MIEHTGGRLHAGRRQQPVLVVFQKQAPGVGVARDQVQHRLPGIVHQDPVPKGPGQEVEGLARFPKAALGEPVIVQGLAAHKVVMHRPGGRWRKRTPLLELTR